MASRRLRFVLAALGFAAAPSAVLLACGGKDESVGMTSGGSDASIDRARLPAPLHPDASCQVTIETPELLPASHVPEGSSITWDSNPPSSGPHYPIWANFQEFDKPIDFGYLVHDMEHGAVVMLYKCDPGPACDAIVAGLRQVRDSLPTDPLCDPSIRVRVVIAPDPGLDVPVAAATWGWTYKAQCLDLPTLEDFAKAHIDQGTENLCAPGLATF